MSTDSLSSSLSSSPSHHDSSRTYEATKAAQQTERNADRVHWDPDAAFRDAPYRQLHHQRGVVGSFRIRLLEASNLQRSYWSALALGPVKHLGFSKAHGAVSSYCTFDLAFAASSSDDDDDNNNYGISDSVVGGPPWNLATSSINASQHLDSKPAAKKSSSTSNTNTKKAAFTSPVIPANDHPVWDNCQFDCVLRKGSSAYDGHRVVLHVKVHEDATTLENLLPGVPGGSDAARLLGAGTLDLTELCLGETSTGQALPGILDAWVPLTLPQHQQQQQREWWESQKSNLRGNNKDNNDNDPLALAQLKPPPSTATTGKTTGSVRVLVSYVPHGLEPQPHDIVALESFARRDPLASSCRPLLPPLRPLEVIERQGPYVLAEYRLPEAAMGTARVRLHRNAVFVVERKNWVDAATNLALLPLDAVAATPLGRATAQVLHPVVAASRELFMPALLSLKLVWVAARTTTLASWSGVHALGTTFWNEGTGSLLPEPSPAASAAANSSSNHSGSGGAPSRSSSGGQSSHHHHHRHHDRSSATAQYVSL